MTTRRDFLTAGAAIAAGAAALTGNAQAQQEQTGVITQGGSEKPSGVGRAAQPRRPPGCPGRDYIPVVTPNNRALEWKIVDGAKVYHLVAEEVQHEFAPGLKANCWGYNGRVHGPTIEAVEGDHVRIYVTNKLRAPTTVHWHGILLPNGMDGVGGLTQKAIGPGETYKYEFIFPKAGTFMYHPHHDEMTQLAMGLAGMIVVHPRQQRGRRPDRQFTILLHEWRIDVGTARPNPTEMSDFNVLTMNARAFPGTDPLLVKRGDLVRIRLGNLSATDHHPIHLHGHHFKLVATDGGEIPTSAQWPESTVLVPVGSTRDIEFVADAPGDWAFHCHMTHHMMNQMGHDIPNMIGANTRGLDQQVQSLLPGYMTMGAEGMSMMEGMPMPKNSIPMLGAKGQFDDITMGGMVTILKVRDNLASYDKDPGWYRHPTGTVSRLAQEDELRRDGISVG